jgi:hypothetical protein
MKKIIYIVEEQFLLVYLQFGLFIQRCKPKVTIMLPLFRVTNSMKINQYETY